MLRDKESVKLLEREMTYTKEFQSIISQKISQEKK